MPWRVETTISGTTGAPYLSVMHFEVETEPPGVQDAVDAVGAFWTALSAYLANDLSWTVSGDVVEFNSDDGVATAFHSVTPASGTFSEAGEKIPFVAQVLVRWGTAGVVNGRQVRGRTFLPGLTQGGIDEGRVLASTQTAIASAAAALVADADAELGVWSRPLWNEAHTEIVREGSFHAVTSASVWDQFASLTGRRD